MDIDFFFEWDNRVSCIDGISLKEDDGMKMKVNEKITYRRKIKKKVYISKSVFS